jgi:general secretion pathway protein G
MSTIHSQREQIPPSLPVFPSSSIVQRAIVQRGFTLLELLVVMVIIGLLASYVAPRYFDQIGKSEVKAARAQFDAFDKALATYRLDTGHYPNMTQGLNALVERPADEPKWAGPYLSKALPGDPWGKPYIYKQPGDAGHEFDVITLGRDGKPGGTGLDADIGVWTSAL